MGLSCIGTLTPPRKSTQKLQPYSQQEAASLPPHRRLSSSSATNSFLHLPLHHSSHFRSSEVISGRSAANGMALVKSAENLKEALEGCGHSGQLATCGRKYAMRPVLEAREDASESNGFGTRRVVRLTVNTDARCGKKSGMVAAGDVNEAMIHSASK